jgi:hypothetical protein
MIIDKIIIVGSGCLKTAQFSPKPASILDVTSVVRILILRKVRNLQRRK